MRLHFPTIATAAALMTGCGAPNYGEYENDDSNNGQENLSSDENEGSSESDEFGKAHFALTQEQNGHRYAVEGSFRVRDEVGNLWGGFDAAKDDGPTHTIPDLPPGVPLELILVGEVQCYVDDVRERDCTYMGAEPNPFSVISNATTVVHVYVQFGLGGEVITLCNGAAQFQLVVTFGSVNGCDCEAGQQCVTTDGVDRQCRATCGGQNPSCSGDQACLMVPGTLSGVCVSP